MSISYTTVQKGILNSILPPLIFLTPVMFPAQAISAEVRDSTLLEEVMVTANRREESVQDVGASVAAFNEEQLQSLRVDSIGGLAQLTPNVEFKRQWGSKGNSSLFYIRGIGQADFNEGSESPTTVYVDDFYVLSNSATDFLMHDTAGAEVLRGPQGTLFGRNATAGAIVVRNNQPSYTNEGNVSASLGNHDNVTYTVMLNVPIIKDKLAARFAVDREKYDPTTKNLFDGPGLGARDTHGGNFLSARGIVRWDPVEKVVIQYKYQYGWVHARNGGDSSEPMIQVPGNTVATTEDGFGFNPSASGQSGTSVVSDGINDFRNEVRHQLLTINYEMTESAKLTSITGYLKQSKYTFEDCDGTPRTICHAYQTTDQDYWTQELRLAVDVAKARVTFGGYYLSLDYANQWTLPITSGTGTFQGHASALPGDTPGGLVQYTPNTSKLSTYSAYGNIGYDFTDKLTLNVGLRWNHERRRFQETEGLFVHNYPDTGRFSINGDTFGILVLDAAGYADLLANHILGPADPVGDPVVDYASQFKSSFVNYQASVDYKLLINTLVYASLKKGVKAGGFNNGLVNFSAFDLGAIPFKNERNNAYEAGVKWSSPEGAVRVNPSIFYYDYKNYQATAFTVVNGSLGVQVVNKDATAYGGEVEVFANLARGLDVYLGAGYVHTKVKDIVNVGAGVAVTRDRELGQAPHFQSSGMVRYEAALPRGASLTNQVSYNYVGRRFVDVLNDTATRLPSHFNLDYSLTYRPDGNSWYVTGYVRNALDSTNPTQKFNFASLFHTGQVNYFPPRFFGIEVGVSW